MVILCSENSVPCSLQWKTAHHDRFFSTVARCVHICSGILLGVEIPIRTPGLGVVGGYRLFNVITWLFSILLLP